MKKTVVLLLIVCLCASAFAGCSTLHGDDDKGANICMFLTSFPQSLDPAAVQYTADTALIFSLIYQPLTAIDENGNVVGALADSWYSYYDDRDEVYKIYFKLKETYWSDNIRVQAQHVADAWIRILSPETQSPYASLLFPIRNALDYKKSGHSGSPALYRDKDGKYTVVGIVSAKSAQQSYGFIVPISRVK